MQIMRSRAVALSHFVDCSVDIIDLRTCLSLQTIDYDGHYNKYNRHCDIIQTNQIEF